LVQLFASVPITVYTTEAGEVQNTDEPVFELKPALGAHVYVAAPLAVRTAVCCETQITVEFTATFGNGLTLTVEVVLLTQLLLSLAVKEYIVLVAGLAITFAPEVPLRPVAGDQE
jgi:hypothetical protein